MDRNSFPTPTHVNLQAYDVGTALLTHTDTSDGSMHHRLQVSALPSDCPSLPEDISVHLHDYVVSLDLENNDAWGGVLRLGRYDPERNTHPASMDVYGPSDDTTSDVGGTVRYHLGQMEAETNLARKRAGHPSDTSQPITFDLSLHDSVGRPILNDAKGSWAPTRIVFKDKNENNDGQYLLTSTNKTIIRNGAGTSFRYDNAKIFPIVDLSADGSSFQVQVIDHEKSNSSHSSMDIAEVVAVDNGNLLMPREVDNTVNIRRSPRFPSRTESKATKESDSQSSKLESAIQSSSSNPERRAVPSALEDDGNTSYSHPLRRSSRVPKPTRRIDQLAATNTADSSSSSLEFDTVTRGDTILEGLGAADWANRLRARVPRSMNETSDSESAESN